MKIDVTIKVDSQNIFIDSAVGHYSETRPALIALSSLQGEEFEQVEAVGMKTTAQEMEDDQWFQERDQGNRKYRVINPFQPQNFEPRTAAMMIDFFCRVIFASIKPKRGNWRRMFGFDRFDLKIRINDYSLVGSAEKNKFEEYLKEKVSKHFIVENQK